MKPVSVLWLHWCRDQDICEDLVVILLRGYLWDWIRYKDTRFSIMEMRGKDVLHVKDGNPTRGDPVLSYHCPQIGDPMKKHRLPEVSGPQIGGLVNH